MTENNEYDFEAIEAAVLETERGRWFLAELARRQKNVDTEALLKAIHKLEAVISEQRPPVGNEALGRELSAMARALKATEADMRSVSSDRLADGGAVPEGRTVFEDVSARAKNLAAGLNATTEALKSASDDLKQDSAVGERIAGIDDDLSRLAEHNLTHEVLNQRIAKAMDLITHLQQRIHASLDRGDEPQEQVSAESAAPDEALNAGEISYFDADRELFAPPEATPAPVPELAADDPENAPHLADMLEDVLAGMQLGGNAAPAAAEATQASERDEAPTAEPSSPAPPAVETAEAPAKAVAPKTPRVIIVREAPSAAPSPADECKAEAASPSQPAAPEQAQAAAAEVPQAPSAAQPDQPAPASTAEAEPGPEAIMKMFADAAAKHGMQPVAPPCRDNEAEAASADKEVKAAPLESMAPGPEERRRIVVIRRGSSADTTIPLEEPESGGAGAKA